VVVYTPFLLNKFKVPDINKFVQFRYKPSYLLDDLHLQSDPATVLKSNRFIAEFSNINLDGGNVIRWKDKVILTTRVFKENPTIDKIQLVQRIENLLETQVLIIPDINTDMTGHADGHIRFIDKNSILVNELKNEYKYWRGGFMKMINQTGLEFIQIPWFEHKDKNYPLSAIGGYTNYLEVGNLILFPVFEIKGNKDEEAVTIIKKVFPDRIVKPINVNAFANFGGVLNCISWTVKI
jgi:agmatine deiminase